MKKFRIIFAILPLLFHFNGIAQSIQPFKSGDKVMFVGNSITHAGYYPSYIWLYYMTHFPNNHITICNKGVGGDDVGQMNERLNVEVFPENPSVVILTFGMNDSGYFDYLNTNNKDSVTAVKVKKCYENYVKAEAKLEAHPQVRKIIMSTSPYDETTTSNKNNYFPGKSKTIEKIAEFQQASALKHHWPFLDLNKEMTPINLREQAINPAFSLASADRIHPGNGGHLVMAYFFLKAQGLAGKDVANVAIDASGNQLIKAENSTITNISAKPSNVKFTYLAKSLPYPIDTLPKIWGNNSAQIDALKFVPFTDDFNREIIAVKNLEAGKYVFKIDGQKIAEWTADELANGVNLAEKMNTPQYQQACIIRDLNQERMDIEVRLRQYSWMEFDILKQKGLLMKDNQAALDTVFSLMNEGFVRMNFENWAKARNPAIREAWKEEMKVLIDKIYTNNKPLPHTITIEKIK